MVQSHNTKSACYRQESQSSNCRQRNR